MEQAANKNQETAVAVKAALEASLASEAATSTAEERTFKTWCAAVELLCLLGGPSVIPKVADTARKSFKMAVRWEHEPLRIVIVCDGMERNAFDGELAELAVAELEIAEGVFKEQGLSIERDDIMIATVIRAIACEELGLNGV